MCQNHRLRWLALWFVFVMAGTNLPADDHSPQPVAPQCSRTADTRLELRGVVSDYVHAVSDRWLKIVPDSDPGILEMFRDRDRLPRRDLVSWAGEFAGKYLTGGVQVYRLTRDPELKAVLADFARELVSLQAEDGYLGPWPKADRLTGRAPNAGKAGGDTWDAWGHYHVMLGLILWHEETGDPQTLACAARIGDLLCDKFLGNKKPRLVDTGSTEMNLAPVHGLCLLYRHTHNPRHLELAQQIVGEFAAVNSDGRPLAGDYLNAALAGKEFYETSKPRWESLHPILGLVELYYLTGDEALSPGVRALVVEHREARAAQQRRFLVGRAGPRKSLSSRRHRNLLHNCLDGTFGRDAAADRKPGRRGRAGAIHPQFSSGNAFAERAVGDLQHSDGRRPQVELLTRSSSSRAKARPN